MDYYSTVTKWLLGPKYSIGIYSLFLHQNVLCKDIVFYSDHALMFLRYSKTDRVSKSVYIYLSLINNDICPFSALKELFNRDPQPAEAPLFRFVGKGFPRQVLVQWIKTYLDLAEVDSSDFSNYSIHQGTYNIGHI